jgi:hypothetical protein
MNTKKLHQQRLANVSTGKGGLIARRAAKYEKLPAYRRSLLVGERRFSDYASKKRSQDVEKGVVRPVDGPKQVLNMYKTGYSAPEPGVRNGYEEVFQHAGSFMR